MDRVDNVIQIILGRLDIINGVEEAFPLNLAVPVVLAPGGAEPITATKGTTGGDVSISIGDFAVIFFPMDLTNADLTAHEQGHQPSPRRSEKRIVPSSRRWEETRQGSATTMTPRPITGRI